MSIEEDITEWYTKFFTDNQTTLNPFNQCLLDELINCKCFNFNPMAITIQNYLTEKQLDFLMSNTLSIFDKDSATYTFIKEIFEVEGENIPIDDSIFLCTMFEMVNLFLYIFDIDKIIPTLNKKTNTNFIHRSIDLASYEENNSISFMYKINPNKQTIKLQFDIFTLSLTYHRPYEKEANSYFNKIKHKVNNLNEFLFKLSTIYDEFIDCMPEEELNLTGGF